MTSLTVFNNNNNNNSSHFYSAFSWNASDQRRFDQLKRCCQREVGATSNWNCLLIRQAEEIIAKCLSQGHNNMTTAGFKPRPYRSKIARVTARPCCRRILITFGLRNSAQCRQRHINQITSNFDFIFVYMDGVLSFNKGNEKHEVQWVVKKLMNSLLSIKMEKNKSDVKSSDY